MGPYTLANRIVMAPLTRSRARPGDVPGRHSALYYRQRATAGLIVAEATQVSPQGKGYSYTPGIYAPAHVEAWSEVTQAVHEEGGRIFLQLWHVGRLSHPLLQPGGGLPVAPSAVRPEGRTYVDGAFHAYVMPRALEIDEIPGLCEQYRHAARLAQEAGFDGVEVQAGNGYLIDQFLRDTTNRREDAYGGSIENRARFLFEVLDAVTSVWGGDRVGVRVAPVRPANYIVDSRPEALFAHVVHGLEAYGLAYLHVVEGAILGPREVPGALDPLALRRLYRGPYMGNNCYDLPLALAARRRGDADFIAFGRPFIANPDLVARLRDGLPLATHDPATLYGGGAKGYVDYPALATAAA
jgi:N-ethylmaleimide reductase